MADIFLSYVRSDAKRARQVAEALEARGWTVWWDASVVPGTRFRDEIEKQLHAARCVVVLWSKKSVKSDWVIDEADDGKKRGVLIQALIEDVSPPHGFRQIQAAQLIGWDGADSGEFGRLCAGVSTFAPPSRSPETSAASAWRSLKEGFNSLGDAKLQANRVVSFKVVLEGGSDWWITGSERSKIQFQLLAEKAGQLLKRSPHLYEDTIGFRVDIDRWLSFVNERVSGSGRIDDLVKASAEACHYCWTKEQGS